MTAMVPTRACDLVSSTCPFRFYKHVPPLASQFTSNQQGPGHNFYFSPTAPTRRLGGDATTACSTTHQRRRCRREIEWGAGCNGAVYLAVFPRLLRSMQDDARVQVKPLGH